MHLIGKQILQLEIDSSKDAYAIQQTMSELVWKELVPAMNDLFDTMVPEDKVVYLDTIEIDLGSIELNGKDTDEIVSKIMVLVEESIKYSLQHIQSQGGGSRYYRKDSEDKFPLKDRKNLSVNAKKPDFYQEFFKNKEALKSKEFQKDSTLSKNTNTHKSLRRHYFDIWLHWLQKGTLPSYAISPDPNWITLVLETLGLDLDAVTILENTLKKYPVALQRLVLQHKAKDLKSIIELYTGFSQSNLLQLFKEIKLLFKEVSPKSTSITIDNRVLEIEIWRDIFSTVILERKKLDSISLGIKVSKLPSIIAIINQTEVQRILTTEVDSKYSFLQEIFKEAAIQIPSEVHPHIIKDVTKVEDLKNEQIEGEEINEQQIECPQFFNNAGMVLLHPFLSSFFKKLNLTEEKDFKDTHSRSKAVMLLHFLATGEEQPKEYEMVLPKFLCEMPVNMPLDHTIELTEEEKEEANNLLQAVIEHWGALGGTSPDGLREGFLIRQGKLEQEQTGWKLLVEQKTLDILLDRLPWNISLIKLPWMKELLKVAWR